MPNFAYSIVWSHIGIGHLEQNNEDMLGIPQEACSIVPHMRYICITDISEHVK